MSCTCAPVIVAEMADWQRLGGANWGCCGNAAHTFGFHLPANELPASDYSRRHDPNPPVNWDYACAGDFAHQGNPGLRARHATLLGRLLHDDPALGMICEFIGQPWPDRPVYYWARWDGTTNLQRYTGQGHDQWSHVSWWRSRADRRAYLWTGTPAPGPTPTPVNHPTWPGRYLRLHSPMMTGADIRTWQQRMSDRGWNIGVDGTFGPQTDRVCRQFQSEKGLGVDGIIGSRTWDAAWTSPVTG